MINSNWHSISYHFGVIAAYSSNFGHFCIFEHPFGGLGTKYDVHLGLIRKRVVDLLLVLIGPFLLGVTAEALQVNMGSKSAILLQQGPVNPKFQVEGVAPTNHTSSWKTRLGDLSYGIKIRTHHSFVLSQITRLTDGQMDGQTEFSSLDRVCIPCNALKLTIQYVTLCRYLTSSKADKCLPHENKKIGNKSKTIADEQK